MGAVIFMSFRKLKRSIETMPRCAYIFLKFLLMLSAVMLLCSLLLFLFKERNNLGHLHLAVLLLETPAGVLLLGQIGLAFFIDRSL